MNPQINPALPQIMWLDLNSAFATTEQQAYPGLPTDRSESPIGLALTAVLLLPATRLKHRVFIPA